MVEPAPDFNELANAWLGGHASAAEQEALLRLLADDANLREELRAQHRQHLRLAAILSAPEHALVAARAKAVAASGTSSALHRTIQGVARRRRRSRPWWPTAVVLATAAAAVVMLTPLWLRPSAPLVAPAAVPALAVLGDASPGASVNRDGRDLPARAGMDLLADDQLQAPDHGTVEVRYPDQTRIELAATTQVRLWDEDGAKRVRLDRGQLRGDAVHQPAGKPMKLLTDQAEAEVVGTRFTLRADALLTRLDVQEGTVSLHANDGVVSVVRADGFAEAGVKPKPPTAAVAARRWANGPSEDPTFFPIGVWLQDPQYAARYRQAGINLYVGLWKNPSEAQLATLRQEGMGLICDQNRTTLRHRGDPTIVGWFLGDGVDNAQQRPDGSYGPPLTPAALMDRYKAAQRADPSRPLMINFSQGDAWDEWYGRGDRTGHPEDYREYLRGGDIAGSMFYPVTHEKPELAGKLWYVARAVERLRQWSDGAKPVWAIIECSRIATARTPTAAQVRAEVWMAVASGATGVVYYVHQMKPEFNDHSLLDDSALLAGVSDLNRQLRELAPVLNEPTAAGAASVAATPAEVPIACLAKRHAGALHLFTVALRDVASTAQISVPGLAAGTAVEVVSENRRIVALAGRFSDVFQPYQQHFYRLP